MSRKRIDLFAKGKPKAIQNFGVQKFRVYSFRSLCINHLVVTNSKKLLDGKLTDHNINNEDFMDSAHSDAFVYGLRTHDG